MKDPMIPNSKIAIVGGKGVWTCIFNVNEDGGGYYF